MRRRMLYWNQGADVGLTFNVVGKVNDVIKVSEVKAIVQRVIRRWLTIVRFFRKDIILRADGVATPSAATPSTDTPASDGKKRNKTQPQPPEAKVNAEAGTTTKTKTTSAVKEASKETTPKKGASTVKKFPNSLEVETLAIGKLDVKQAAAGKKVSGRK